ncbi:WD40 repeat-like protein [Microthyrium microscopicum]|uniref:WD40 repeat-like protein n=1 Tax=Microthyrium microscopicum TaxID=703497 RepID=A0A6A6U8U7_9PEZI|nr:WD40 repeat-like protein [Microthyrium microscopicum]
MSAEKRAASNSLSSGQVVKRQKSDTNMNTRAIAVRGGNTQSGALIQSGARASGLQSPVMELVGHSGEVFATRFDHTGQFIASGSMDRTILLWRAQDDCANYGSLGGHKGAILDLHWSRDSRVLFSASADMMLASWDLETGVRIRRHTGHEEVINTMDVSKRGEEVLVSGSDDGYIGLWDSRQKEAIDFIETDFPVTAVALSEAGNELYSGGIDNDIRVWDIRKKSVAYSLIGHHDTITSLRVSPDSQTLLSNSHDSTVRTWDIRPFAPVDRKLKTYDGAPTGMEKNLLKANWDAKGQKIIAGSGDHSVTVWDTNSGKLLFKLPGHKGAVNDVQFSPIDDQVVVSGSSDRMVMLGELGR